MVVDLFRSRATLEAEIWTLRQQINVLRRTAPTKHAFSAIDRLIFVGLYWLFPKVRDALAILKPETVVRWHRAGFRSVLAWKSRCPYCKSNPGILMMQSAQDRMPDNASSCLGGA
jgi:hypothetical protein